MLLAEKLKKYDIILGSKSPRRHQLLADSGFEFRVASDYFCDESYPDDLDQLLVPEYIAAQKAKAYPFELAAKEILITADTVVLLDGKILGKPHDKADAKAMVASLSGRTHRVVTGVVMVNDGRKHSFSAVSEVTFRELSAEEIEHYVEHYKPFDKAGSYGIQEWIGYIGIQSINGSFFNVMGLPTQMLYTALDSFIGF